MTPEPGLTLKGHLAAPEPRTALSRAGRLRRVGAEGRALRGLPGHRSEKSLPDRALLLGAGDRGNPERGAALRQRSTCEPGERQLRAPGRSAHCAARPAAVPSARGTGWGPKPTLESRSGRRWRPPPKRPESFLIFCRCPLLKRVPLGSQLSLPRTASALQSASAKEVMMPFLRVKATCLWTAPWPSLSRQCSVFDKLVST